MNSKTASRRIGKILESHAGIPAVLEIWNVDLPGGTTQQVICSVTAACEIEVLGLKVLIASDRALACNLQGLIDSGGRWELCWNGDEDPRWSGLVRVEPSKYQGVDIHLEGGIKLQACFPEQAIYQVRRA